MRAAAAFAIAALVCAVPTSALLILAFGQPLVDTWTAGPAPDGSWPINLTAGQTYRVGMKSNYCDKATAYSMRLTVERARDNALIWTEEQTLRNAKSCGFTAWFGDIYVPDTGTYRIRWTISAPIAASTPSMELRAPWVGSPLLYWMCFPGWLASAVAISVALRVLGRSRAPAPPLPPKPTDQPPPTVVARIVEAAPEAEQPADESAGSSKKG